MDNIQSGRQKLSVSFLLMAITFNVCLIASNLFETKLFMAGPVALTGGVIIFPISYIINDCLVEVWGYRKARLVIWSGFLMNFFVVAMAQIVRILPAAPFWDGGPHFDYVFAMAPRVTLASMMAFLCGSTVNAWIMSRMKVASKGKRFSLRAIVSSIGGETVDSLIFFPIAFWGLGAKEMLQLMLTQIVPCNQHSCTQAEKIRGSRHIRREDFIQSVQDIRHMICTDICAAIQTSDIQQLWKEIKLW